MSKPLPTFDDVCARLREGNADALDRFIYNNEPQKEDDSRQFRIELLALIALLERFGQADPIFWYRPRSDGGFEGPIHNDSIEQARKESGAWLPLHGGPQPDRVAELEKTERQRAALEMKAFQLQQERDALAEQVERLREVLKDLIDYGDPINHQLHCECEPDVGYQCAVCRPEPEPILAARAAIAARADVSGEEGGAEA